MARSSKFGTVNYSAGEMRRLNAKVRAVLPLAGEDWLRVAYYFNYQRPEAVPFRDVESLKRKFKKMYCSRGKTLPDYVAEAKELRKLIQQTSKQTIETEEQEQEQELEEKELTLKLRQMEDEYQRILEGERIGEGMEDKATTEDVNEQPGALSTTQVIALLRQSVERKRRAVEEKEMVENARVRRERKKRKLDKVLLSIHHKPETEEQSEVLNSGSSADANRQNQGESTLNPAAPALPAQTQPEEASSHGIMELILQVLSAQQIESSQRFEAEQVRREQERLEREERWRQTELRREREHRQLMTAMGVLLGDRFPESLKHYLNEEDVPSATPVCKVTPLSQDTNGASNNQEPSVSTSTATIDRHET